MESSRLATGVAESADASPSFAHSCLIAPKGGRVHRRNAWMFEAVGRGDLQELMRALRAGANPRGRQDPAGGEPMPATRPLLLAAAAGSFECLVALGQAGGFEQRDDHGRDALMFAARFGRVECARYLASRCDLGAVDSYRAGAFLHAAQGGSVEVGKVLLAAGCDPLARGPRGIGPLGMAARCRRSLFCQWLASTPGAALAKDDEGATPLMAAAMDPSGEALRAILPFSDPLARDHDGMTALMWAAALGMVRCVQELLPASVATALSHDGEDAAAIAARHGHLEISRSIEGFAATDPERREIESAVAAAAAQSKRAESL
jgi:hypothetical protein